LNLVVTAISSKLQEREFQKVTERQKERSVTVIRDGLIAAISSINVLVCYVYCMYNNV
jgi:hypothetical protein